MSGGIGNLGAANLLKNKNDAVKAQYERAEGWMKHAKGLQRELDILSARNTALSQRNERLECLVAKLTEKGVASEALGVIHTLKAEILQKQADKENWSIEKRREVNLRLAAETEYDYRLKNDPCYRMKTVADDLMQFADGADCEDKLRHLVSQLNNTSRVRSSEEKDRMIEARIDEMRGSAQYKLETDTVPVPDSIPPARLEMDENNPEEFDTFSEVRAAQNQPVWVKPLSHSA